jgi:phosphonate transport system ATP-binding protein
LCCGSSGVCALDGASLTFERASFIVLLGPSGAGKSTLLRCLSRLVRPSRGDVCGSNDDEIEQTRSRPPRPTERL